MHLRRAALKNRRRKQVLAEALECRTLLDATVVPGLPQQPASSNPSGLTVSGNMLFFASTAGGFGNELWATDGTVQGTHLISDINPGIASSNPTDLTDVNGLLFFTATDSSGQRGLWRTDGTAAGTAELVTAASQTPLSAPGVDISGMTKVGSRLFFAFNNVEGGPELWTSDGTAAGTRQVVQLAGAPATIEGLVDVNGTAFFWKGNASTESLWKSNGTATGTIQLGSDPSWQPWGANGPGQLNGFIYFPEQGVMWESDGTTSGTMPVPNFPVTPESSTKLVQSGGLLYFNSDFYSKLWRTDGTAAGTSLVVTGVAPEPVASLNDSLLFESGGPGGWQLWKTDGTPAGNLLLANLPEYVSASANVQGRLFLTTAGQLWVSDGTPEGTMKLASLGYTDSLAAFTGKLYLSTQGSLTTAPALNLWVSDGTSSGTVPFGNLAPGTANIVAAIGAAGDSLFIDSLPPGGFPSASHLWVTTPASASATDLAFPPLGDAVWDLEPVGARMFFLVGEAPDGLASYLGVSVGTPAGTHRVSNQDVSDFIPFNGSVLFLSGGNVWITNGTAQEQVTIGTTAYGQLAAVGRLAFFTAGASNNELWVTDGTPLNQSRIATIGQGLFVTQWIDMTAVGSDLIFFARSASDLQLWRSDGTSGGTVMVKDFGSLPAPGAALAVGNTLFFSFDDGAHGDELWKTDGTVGGTAMVADIHPGAGGSNPSSFIQYNGRLYFTADDGTHGLELWTSDGTAGGTHIVADINPGPGGSNPSAMAVAGGLLYFNAFSPQYGNELWSSDGSAAGTALVQDLYPGPGSSDPRQLTDADGTLYFVASDSMHQGALWKLPVGGVIEGSLFNDANHNGTQDPGEGGLANWTVYLDTNHNGLMDAGEPRTNTDSLGHYRFSDLRPGTYWVRQVTKSGYGRTAPEPAAASFQLAAGEDVSLSFGNVPLASVPMDFAYLLKLAQHYNSSGTFIDGDANGDETVNFNDLLLVAQNYGHALANASEAAAASAGSSSLAIELKPKRRSLIRRALSGVRPQ